MGKEEKRQKEMCLYLAMQLHFCGNLRSLTDAVNAQPRSPGYLLPAAASAAANASHCSLSLEECPSETGASHQEVPTSYVNTIPSHRAT